MVMHNKTKTSAISLASILFLAVLIVPSVYADESIVDVVTINVPVSCSMSASGTDSHTANVNNGQTTGNIGTTNLKVICNDNSGYAIYAIGYTDDTYGKTVLTSSTLGSTHDIATATTVTTGTSSWAMKLAAQTGTYAPIIAGSTEDSLKQTGDPDFSDYTAVPSTYTKVAYYTSSTDTGNNATGSNLTTTYRAYISPSQPAGTYIGQVKYTLVHPQNGGSPFVPPSSCSNPVSGAEYMQEINASNKTTILAGMQTGTRYYLKDARDEKAYCVGKLADGNLWMLDNLALDIVATDLITLKGNTNASDITLEYLKGTHVRGDGNLTQDTNYPTTSIGYFDNINTLSDPRIAVSGNCSDAYCVNDPENGKWTSESITEATINNLTSVVQGKIGVYYNYCAASAGSFCYGDGTNTTGAPSSDPDTSTLQDIKEDICPKGWRLPTGKNGGEYNGLYAQYSGGSPSQKDAFQKALSTPLSGSFLTGGFGTGAYNQGYYGYFLSSTWYDSSSISALTVNAYNQSSYVNTTTSHYSRSYCYSVRCIAQ